MKRKSQILALLMALCLLASLAVVPAAAATAAELEAIATAKKQAWDTAESAVTTAKSDLEAAQNAVSSAQTAYTNAQSTTVTKQNAYNQAKQAAETAAAAVESATNEEEKASLTDAAREAKTAEENAERELSAAQTAESDALTALNTAQSESGSKIAAAQAAVTSAETVAATAKKEYEDAKAAADAAKAEENKPTAPTGAPSSSDLSCPSSVDLGTLEKDASSSSRTKTFTLKNSSAYAMTLSASSPSGWTVSGVPSTLAAGESATVTVQLSSASSTGNYDKRLTITASFAGGSGSSEFSVSLRAEVAEKGYSITADPASKDLGKLKEGYTEAEAKEKEVTVTIQNKGATSVRMDGVKGNDHFTVTAVRSDSETLANGDKTNYKIVPKQSLAVGTYTDTITFQTREGATATFKATVVIEKKVDPLTVEPATLDFGVAEEGYAALTPQTVTVKNNTEYAVRLEQPSSFSYEIGLLSQTSLSAGGSATFSIRPRTGLPANLYDGVVEIYGYSGDSAQTAKLTVKFTVNRPAGPSTFTDVPADSTFAADIAYVSQKGLMGGVGEGRFNPQAPITRGQLVTILYRLEGQPAVSGAGFPDVAAGSYCEKAVKWAAANAITAGGNDGLFRPGDPITRQQLATFLYRYNNYKGYMVAKQADLSTFADGSAVASYAKDALSWANGTGLVNGTSDGRLNPSGGATRGQAAAILHRFCVSIGK